MEKFVPDLIEVLKLLIIPLIIWYFEWKTTKRDEKRDREYIERKKAQDEKDEMIMRGLKTLSDCDYEIIYDLKNGEHNGGLDECMKEITQYKADVTDWILHRAAWNK